MRKHHSIHVHGSHSFLARPDHAHRWFSDVQEAKIRVEDFSVTVFHNTDQAARESHRLRERHPKSVREDLHERSRTYFFMGALRRQTHLCFSFR